MAARFKSIEEKGGLPVHLLTLGIEAAYFYHLDDLGLKNTVIAKLLEDRCKRKVDRHAVGRWRKYRKEHPSGQEDKDTNL